jgi:hypothetical protein
MQMLVPHPERPVIVYLSEIDVFFYKKTLALSSVRAYIQECLRSFKNLSSRAIAFLLGGSGSIRIAFYVSNSFMGAETSRGVFFMPKNLLHLYTHRTSILEKNLENND